MKRNMRRYTYSAIGAALLIISALISIPTVPPFTLQSFCVLTLIGLLGLKVTLLAYTVYLSLGIIGIPVFSGLSGGISVILGPTGGYLLGFVFSILTVGLTLGRNPRSGKVTVISYLLGMCVLYTVAVMHYAAVWLRDLSFTAIWGAFSVCVIPFVLPDMVKLAAAVYVTKRLEGRILK